MGKNFPIKVTSTRHSPFKGINIILVGMELRQVKTGKNSGIRAVSRINPGQRRRSVPLFVA
jgi:hypothetical protein